ncbi:MAG: alpha/beta fold hydrolase [Candidatus Melainabacteria bacterium]|nr:MAG: alpha/beta fold hydrolase [Candidatus Melainabacteria bacterium]
MVTKKANRWALHRTIAALSMSLLMFGTIGSAAQGETPTPNQSDNYGVEHKLKFPVYIWRKENVQPKGIIIGCHGGCLHGRSYKYLGKEMAKNDFVMASIDLHGFGKYRHEGFGDKSQEKVHYKRSMVDFYLLIKELKAEYPGVPVYTLGESLGANVALYLANSRPDLVDGVVAVSPFGRPKYFFSPYHFVVGTQALFAPWTQLNLNPYLSKRLTSDVEMALEECNDPLNRNRQSAIELTKGFGMLYRGRRLAKSIASNKPILFVCDHKDMLCDEKGSRLLFNNLKTKNKTYIQIKDAGHLLVEKSRIHPDTIKALNTWLNEKSNRFKLSLAKPSSEN